MRLEGNLILKKFLIWRIKHIPNKQFIHFVSILVGVLSGLLAATMKNTTYFFQQLVTSVNIEYQSLFYFIFPIIGILLTRAIIRYGIKKPVNHGIPGVLYALSKRKGILPAYQMFASLFTAPITIGFGGSTGLEGPTISGGAGIASNVSRLLHLNQATRSLLIGCAAAAAISAIFKAPIAAIIFAIEVFSLDLTLASMLPLLLASLSAIITSRFFFGSDVLLSFKIEDAFVIADIPFFIILGVIGGGVSIYFTETYERIQAFFDKIASPVKRLLVGGIGLGILVYFIPPLYGEGFEVINNLLSGDNIEALQNNFMHLDLTNVWVVILLLFGLVIFKIIASAFTFGAGGVGGIFAPTLFMGSVMGNCVAKIINTTGISNVSESNFTLVGMAGLMAGVLHAPLTAIFLIAELTGGYDLFIPLMLTAAISYSIAKYAHPYSVYAMQLGRKGELITHNKDHAVLTLMEINTVIENNFVSVYSEMNLEEMIKHAVVKSNRNIFPVIRKEDDKLTGIILLDDLRPIMFDRSLYKTVFARDVMQNPPEVIIIGKDKMTDIMKKFKESGAWNLPVVKEGKYIGFISKSKLLTAYRNKLIEVTA